MQPPYGAPPYARPAGPTNSLAIASLVLGVLWIFWLGSALAIIFSLVSLRQIRESGDYQQGRGIAVAGLILGLVGAVTLVLTIILVALGTPVHQICQTNPGATGCS